MGHLLDAGKGVWLSLFPKQCFSSETLFISIPGNWIGNIYKQGKQRNIPYKQHSLILKGK
jgi:hypothetical protein